MADRVEALRETHFSELSDAQLDACIAKLAVIVGFWRSALRYDAGEPDDVDLLSELHDWNARGGIHFKWHAPGADIEHCLWLVAVREYRRGNHAGGMKAEARARHCQELRAQRPEASNGARRSRREITARIGSHATSDIRWEESFDLIPKSREDADPLRGVLYDAQTDRVYEIATGDSITMKAFADYVHDAKRRLLKPTGRTGE
ncbi:MAG: hypothetical protein GWN84_19970 [Gammaproteobacteria bacterium]|nr:hypothetical protein [Gammaproteobacteria bacterium]NIR85099.1 hypothetical protein [Gammaproteobacteria bacterium]NIR92009.1 hypothetical protein [Gammaproteobacteria bacterium]NIU06148.1 hypothetical protein [Gammaproteobacteria bacterium]NIV53091.1 hypothetical protein [Gammaproteobacteria bacterium]